MTNEEKAEEYAIKTTDELRRKGFLSNEEISQRYAGISQGVLYGLAEGKPKWHDLRKNPDDLPKESGDYWCKLKSNRLYTFEVYYTDSLFYKSRWDELDIIAWCELPIFEE